MHAYWEFIVNTVVCVHPTCLSCSLMEPRVVWLWLFDLTFAGSMKYASCAPSAIVLQRREGICAHESLLDLVVGGGRAAPLRENLLQIGISGWGR